jgi:isoamyl acetate esterase
MGWGLRLQFEYIRKLDVINRGFSGFNTRWCKKLLPEILKAQLLQNTKIRLFTLFLGANDAVIPSSHPEYAVPLDEFNANLHSMLQTIHSLSPHTRIVLITPPPVNPKTWEPYCIAKGRPLDRSVSRTHGYRDETMKVYNEYVQSTPQPKSVLLVDTWTLFLRRDVPSSAASDSPYTLEEVDEYLEDGLHLSRKGNELLGEFLVRRVRETWADLDAEKMGTKVPLHGSLRRDSSMKDVCGFA